MLKINIIAVGKIKDKYIVDGIDEYSKRISKYAKLNFIELNEEIDSNVSVQKESNTIAENLDKMKGYKVLMDINSKQLSSLELSNLIEDVKMYNSEISFIIGGSNGVNDIIRNKCDFRLSFSKLTFPHQLFRLILIEQIYRAIAIANNIKYHK